MREVRNGQSDFAGRHIVVTGAGGGIGLATTEVLVARGAMVVASDIDAERLEAAEECGATTVVADMSLAEGRAELASMAGHCDGLVTAHGIVRPKPVAETTEEDWDRLFEVNAKSVFFVCKAFADALRDEAAVVLVSSVSARSAASLEQAVYCASKAAVSSIARSFAHAYAARNIRVNAILPGIVDTRMQEDFLQAAAFARGSTPAEVHKARLAQVPLHRTATALECAEAIAWLLSPTTRYMTGQQIAFDGGLTMY